MRLGQKLSLRQELFRIAKFVFVGGLNIGAGYAVFAIFHNLLNLHYLIAYSLAVVLWTGAGYEIQRRWVFRAPKSGSAFAKYLVPQVFFWVVGLLGLSLGVELMGLNPQIAYFLNLIVLSVGLYLYSRLVVFTAKKTSAAGV